MIELLSRAAARWPDSPAVLTHDRTASYRELEAAAAVVAGEFTRRRIDRFGVMETDAARIIVLLAAASLAGAEACVYPWPDGSAETAETASLAARLGHGLVFTDSVDVAASVEVLSFDELLAGACGRRPTPATGMRTLLVMTTGTSGVPRAARHEWTRLLRTVDRVTGAPGQRWLLAFGPHQFAGLQVLLHVAAAGATLVAPAPRRPREGLAAMRSLGVTHASATPTYWRFLLAEMSGDGGSLPALEQITLGGEAVPRRLLDDLRATFPAARISQVYAATEFGSSGSVRDGERGLPLSLLDRGPDADLAVKIVDGELWVRSRTGMLGYHGEQPVNPDGWRATGDLVEIVDGRIVFAGRRSSVINVGGTKVHPLPIEERINAVPGVAMARVYGRPNAMTGSIVAVEVEAANDADPAALVDAVRAVCADLPPAARPRSVKIVDRIRTVGDKIGRRADDA